MIKQTPSIGRILAMVAFTLSCFGILVFLWLSFGGSVPLQPEGYRVTVEFPEATQLAQEADVRISGVPVGSVKTREPNETTGLTDTIIEIDARYAPLPSDTRAILRQKTLLGETYVELSPGDRGSGLLEDGGALPRGQVADTVQLDEILRTFDPVTRQRFTTWFDQQGIAARGRADEISAGLALLTPFAEETDEVLSVLRVQSTATRGLIRDTGEVFAALTERKGQLRDLILNSNRTWEAIASRDAQLADTFRVFPTFLRESRATTERVTQFANEANPLITQLRPAARQLSPTLIDLDQLAPDLRGFFEDLAPLVRVSRRGLPATEQVLDNTQPAARAARPVPARADADRRLPGPVPARDHRLLRQRLGRDPGRSGPASTSPSSLHYLRVMNPLNPEMMTGYPYRLGDEPLEPVHRAGRLRQAPAEGQPRRCSAATSARRTPRRRPPPPNEFLCERLADEIQRFVFGRHREPRPGAARAWRRRRSAAWWASPGCSRTLQPLPVSGVPALFS